MNGDRQHGLPNLCDDSGKVIALETRLKFAERTTVLKDSPRRTHGLLAVRAVNLVLNFSVREPTKKNTAMLQVLCRSELLLACFAKLIHLSFKLAVLFLKPFIFLNEKLHFVLEQQDSLGKDGSTSVLAD